MKISDIIKALEQWAPPSYQESYDNAGLLTGNRGDALTGVLVSLDCTEAVVDEAIQNHCNLIVAHHPIIFRGLKSITGKNYVERTIIKAIKNDIAIYAIHTNLDNVHTGVNRKIADQLGLLNPTILAPKKELLNKLVVFVPKPNTQNVLDALYKAGAGEIGNYDHCSFTMSGTGTFRPNDAANPTIGHQNVDETVEEDRIEVIFENHKTGGILNALKQAHPYEEVAYYLTQLQNVNQEVGSGMVGRLEAPMQTHEFLHLLKEKMQTGCVRHTPIHQEKVQKIAVCGGAGSFLLSKAKSVGADVFITADFKYHEFFDADGKIIIADIGHYESEVFTKELISEYLSEKLTNIAPLLSKVDTNPLKYL